MSELIGRRGVLLGIAATGTVVVTGCGKQSTPPAAPAAPAAGASGSSSPFPLVAVADVPVGSGVLRAGPNAESIMVTRPDESTILAVSAICTHQGCTVQPKQGELDCPCHGSTYDLQGHNTGGPAPRPLAQYDIRVTDGQVFLV